MLHDGKAGEKGKLITQLPLFFLFGISPENAVVEEFAMFLIAYLSSLLFVFMDCVFVSAI